MAEKSTFIKIDRNITSWRWYGNSNTMRVFMHLLLMANIKDAPFEKIIVKRGQLVTSYDSLREPLNLTVKECRTAINHLTSTNEISVKQFPKFLLITINNYEKYQKIDRQANKPKSANKGFVFVQSGIAPNGEPYMETNGIWYNRKGKKLNSMGYEDLDF